jgi:DNA-binding PadR family transcriptional regulator
MADVLGAFEQAVLLAMVRLGEGAYGRAILKDVQEHLLRPVAPGAVHATLTRLEARGLVASRLGTGTPDRGGRARRFYRFPPRGSTSTMRALPLPWQGVKWLEDRRSAPALLDIRRVRYHAGLSTC